MKSAFLKETEDAEHFRPVLPSAAGAALRMIGHCSRHGGALWGAYTAREYLPQGNPLLCAMISRLTPQEQDLIKSGKPVTLIGAKSRAQREPSQKKNSLATFPCWSLRKYSRQQLMRRPQSGGARRNDACLIPVSTETDGPGLQSSPMPSSFRSSRMRS